MNTSFKPNLEQFGQFKIKKNIQLKKLRKPLAVIAALPLCSAWLFLVIPFLKGTLMVRI
jgi:hypothetical protein